MIVLIDPGEREHAIERMRQWAADPVRWPGTIAAETIAELIVSPLQDWLARGAPPGRTDTDAGLALLQFLDDLAARFENGMMVVPESLDRCDELWRDFQAAVGNGAAMLRARDRASRHKWQTSGGKTRKGKLSPFRHAVEALCDALRTRDIQAVLREMRADAADESDALDDLRARRTDPIVIRFQVAPDDATDNTAVIGYVHVITGAEDERTVKTLKNYLA